MRKEKKEQDNHQYALSIHVDTRVISLLEEFVAWIETAVE